MLSLVIARKLVCAVRQRDIEALDIQLQARHRLRVNDGAVVLDVEEHEVSGLTASLLPHPVLSHNKTWVIMRPFCVSCGNTAIV